MERPPKTLSFDFQAHVCPQDYLEVLAKLVSFPRARFNSGKLVLQYGKGMVEQRHLTIAKLQDFAGRVELMDELGIKAEVLSPAIPAAIAGTPNQSISLARMINNHIANAMKEYEGRYYGFASLPLLDVRASMKELDRAINELHFSGVSINSNVNGEPIDSHRYWKIYEKIEELGASLYIHPMTPYLANENVLRDYQLWGPAFGYTFDTALAILRFINSGIMEEYSEIPVMIGHLGECLPYIMDRIDWAFKRFPGVAKRLARPPHEYLKMMYVDTAGIFTPASLECAGKLLDPDKIVFASDYPFEDMESSLNYIKNSSLSSSQKEAFLEKNGKKFLGI